VAQYAKTTLLTVVSANSDYSDPQVNYAHTKEYTTPTEVLDITLATATGGTTVTWTTFTTLSSVEIENKDSAIVITATYRTGGGGVTTQTIAIPAGESVKLVDVTASTALTLTSASGTPLARVVAYGV
jgi:hypothetical protein